MPKQHELLAIREQRKGQSSTTMASQRALFSSKQHHFHGTRTLVVPLKEGERESEEAVSDLQTSVGKELAWVSTYIAAALDTSLGVEISNQIAKADIVLDNGQTIAKDVPATALLELEKNLAEIKAMADTIPTLDPAKGFTPDAQRPGVFVAREVVKMRTRKEKVVITKAPATDKFAAQTELIDQDVPVARLHEQAWSSMITPVQKADCISRIEELIRAVKKARSRANSVDVPAYTPYGETLLNYAFGQLYVK